MKEIRKKPAKLRKKNPTKTKLGLSLFSHWFLLCDWQYFPHRCHSRSCQFGWSYHPRSACNEKERENRIGEIFYRHFLGLPKIVNTAQKLLLVSQTHNVYTQYLKFIQKVSLYKIESEARWDFLGRFQTLIKCIQKYLLKLL